MKLAIDCVGWAGFTKGLCGALDKGCDYGYRHYFCKLNGEDAFKDILRYVICNDIEV